MTLKARTASVSRATSSAGNHDRRTVAPMARLSRYWHGGAPRLRPGDKIRPAASLSRRPVAYDGPDYDTDPAWVYVTTSRALAQFYAAIWRDRTDGPYVSGDLYNVRPRGELLPDPDYPGLGCFRCASAVVVVAVERAIVLTERIRLRSAQFTTWRNGGPVFDAAGYFQPSPEMAASGITAEDLAVLGVLPDYEQGIAYAAELMKTRGRA